MASSPTHVKNAAAPLADRRLTFATCGEFDHCSLNLAQFVATALPAIITHLAAYTGMSFLDFDLCVNPSQIIRKTAFNDHVLLHYNVAHKTFPNSCN